MQFNDPSKTEATAFVILVGSRFEHVYTLDVFNFEQSRDIQDVTAPGSQHIATPMSIKLSGSMSKNFRGANAQDVAEFADLRAHTSMDISSMELMEALRVKHALPGIRSLRVAWDLWMGLCGDLYQGVWQTPGTPKNVRRLYKKFLKRKNKDDQ